jgi:hypothetical protein
MNKVKQAAEIKELREYSGFNCEASEDMADDNITVPLAAINISTGRIKIKYRSED